MLEMGSCERLKSLVTVVTDKRDTIEAVERGHVMIPSLEAVKAINQLRGDSVVVSTMTARQLFSSISQRRELDIPIIGCMGKASSFGLGLALAQPDRRVMVLDGDGGLLMNLGALVTIANKRPDNLVHILFQDGVYTTTGSQPVPSPDGLSFAGIAREAGISESYEFDDLEEFVSQLEDILKKKGPIFICLKVVHPEELPTPPDKLYEALRVVAETLQKG